MKARQLVQVIHQVPFHHFIAMHADHHLTLKLKLTPTYFQVAISNVIFGYYNIWNIEREYGDVSLPWESCHDEADESP